MGDDSIEALSAAARAAEREKEDELHLRGIRANHAKSIANIKRLKSGGMSRITLIRIYGRDIVDQALGSP